MLLAGAGEDAQDFGQFGTRAAEPVRDLGVELGDLSESENPVAVAEDESPSVFHRG